MSSRFKLWPFRRDLRKAITVSTGPLEKASVDEKKGYVISEVAWSDERPHPADLDNYESYYLKDSEFYAAVNVLANMSVGIGYYTEAASKSPNAKKAKELVDAMAETVGLDQIHLDVAVNMLKDGFCPVERYFKRGPPKGNIVLKVLPPKTVWVLMNERGKLLGYRQKVGGRNVATFQPNELVFYRNGDGTYGKSIAAPIVPLMKASEQFHTDMPKIIHRHGNPLIFIITRGDKGLIEVAVKERDVDDAVFIDHVDSTEDFNIKTVEVDPRSRFVEYIQELNASKMEALQAPLIRYLHNATEASATKILEVIDRRIEGIQRYIKRMDEREVFAPFLALHGNNEIPSLRWGVPQTGVEEINIDNFLSTGAEIGYISRLQYLDILKQKGLRILPGEDREEPEPPPIPKDEEPEDEESFSLFEKQKFMMVDKRIDELESGEYTFPHQSGRYRGTSVGRDDNGYFVCTHRARCHSRPSVADIPDKVIQFIRSTG